MLVDNAAARSNRIRECFYHSLLTPPVKHTRLTPWRCHRVHVRYFQVRLSEAAGNTDVELVVPYLKSRHQENIYLLKVNNENTKKV